MTSGGWHEALDAQNDLAHSFKTTEGEGYLKGFAMSLEQQAGREFMENGGERWGAIIPGKTVDTGEAMRHVVRAGVTTVLAGDPMWVSGDVVDLVQEAAETFRAEAIVPADLIVESAFALLEKPLVCRDYSDGLLAYRAISWHEAVYDESEDERGVVFALWSHTDDEDDANWQDAVAGMGRSPIVGGSKLVLAHVGHMPYGYGKPYHNDATHYLACQLQVLWRLAQQRVVVSGRHQVPRFVWRRKSNWRQIKHVNVITLRRTLHKPTKPGEAEVNWTHRWAVGGHWRNQWYPSIGMHRQIWIAPHVKGPEDLPLVTKGRAIEFVR